MSLKQITDKKTTIPIALMSFYLFLLTVPLQQIFCYEIHGYSLRIPYIFGLLFVAIYFIKSENRKNIQLDIDEKIFLLFVLWSFTTSIWSINKTATIVISFIYLLMLLIYMAVKRLKIDRIKCFSINMVLSLFLSIFGLYQLFGSKFGLPQEILLLDKQYIIGTFAFPRIQSTFYEPSFLAGYLIISIFTTIYLIFSVKKPGLYLISLFVLSVTLFLTASRGGIISLIISLLALVTIYSYHKLLKQFKKIMLVLFTIISAYVATCFLLAILFGNIGLTQYFNQIRNSDDVLQVNTKNELFHTRSYTIRLALSESINHPFGIGTAAFGSLPQFHNRFMAGRTRQTVNSLYPEIAVENGFIGLILFIMFIFWSLHITITENHSYHSYILFAASLAIFVQYASISTLFLPHVWLFLGLVNRHKSLP